MTGSDKKGHEMALVMFCFRIPVLIAGCIHLVKIHQAVHLSFPYFSVCSFIPVKNSPETLTME